MSLGLSWSLSLPNALFVPACDVSIRASFGVQEVPIRMTSCCLHKFSTCIIQRTDKAFLFTDQESADYSGATEIKFRVRARLGSPLLFEHTLTGGGISVVDGNRISLTITSAQSTLLTTGRAHAEIWAALADGSEIAAVGDIKVTLTDGAA